MTNRTARPLTLYHRAQSPRRGSTSKHLGGISHFRNRVDERRVQLHPLEGLGGAEHGRRTSRATPSAGSGLTSAAAQNARSSASPARAPGPLTAAPAGRRALALAAPTSSTHSSTSGLRLPAFSTAAAVASLAVSSASQRTRRRRRASPAASRTGRRCRSSRSPRSGGRRRASCRRR